MNSQVIFVCVDERSFERYINYETAKAREDDKTVFHISSGDLNDVVLTDDVYIISNAQHFTGLRDFILKCEKSDKSVVVIFNDKDYDLFVQNILPAIPLCDSITKSSGKKNKLPQIVLCTGPMRSGKSEELLRLTYRYMVVGDSILCFTPSIDTRSGPFIKSRNGCFIKSIVLRCLSEFDTTSEAFQKAKCIVIDEGQFFGDKLYDFVKLCKELNKTVYISGLDGNTDRMPFGQVLNCIPLCDKVTKFHALCMVENDGTPASFTQFVDKQLVKEGEVQIGDHKYVSVCRKAYLAYLQEFSLSN